MDWLPKEIETLIMGSLHITSEVLKMVYKKDDWTLYKKEVTLRGGQNQTIYFFSKHKPKSGEPCDKPDNMEVGVNTRTGLPYLKKIFKT